MKKLITKLITPKPAPVPFLPSGIRVYCIGDIHGRIDLLHTLSAKIKYDAHDFSGRVIVIYLGDFIDRGLHSKEVIHFLIHDKNPKFEYVYLRGNHEQVLLDSLQDENVVRSWLGFGGKETLASYGIAINRMPIKQNELLNIQNKLQDALPVEHYQFINQTQFSYALGSYFFVHAGIHPSYPIIGQKPKDLLWIREKFVSSKKNFEKIVVHGHTLTEKVDILPNRIAVDTGAYFSNMLSCLVLEEEQYRIIDTC